MRRRRWGTLVSACAAAALALALGVPGVAKAETTKTFEVGSSAEFTAAVNEINAADGGEYVIKLTDDVTLGRDNYLEKNVTTILGEGHVLNGGNNVTVGAKGTATLRLGQKGYAGELKLDGAAAHSAGPMVGVSGSAKLEMYDGVTISNNAPYGSAGGVQLNDSAMFTMYGGTIKNCGNESSFPGSGVYAEDSSFSMYGGSIEGCVGLYGGGAYVSGSGSMLLDGGTIKNCKAQLGGGICANEASQLQIKSGLISGNTAQNGGGVAVFDMKESVTSFFHRKFLVSGGTISGNHATNGGGLLLSTSNSAEAISGIEITGNDAQIGGGVLVMSNSQLDISGEGNVICNNTATKGASDIFLNESDDTIKLPSAASMGKTYRDSGKKIDGWYVDNPTYVPSENAVATDVSGKLKGELALVASYKVPTEANVTLDNNDEAGTSTTVTVKIGETVTRPTPDPTRVGYRFAGWFVQAEDGSLAESEYDFSLPVEGDLTLVAKWVKTWGVTFDDGNDNVTTATVDDGTTVPEPATPTADGYEFLGWWASPDFSGEKYDFSAPVTADLKLYGGWRKTASDPAKPSDGNGGAAGNANASGSASATPKTGDATTPAAGIALAAVSALAAGVALRRRND